MRFNILAASLAVAALLSACAVQLPPQQPAPAPMVHREEHPAYLHALSDLRAARWLISHRPGDVRVSVDESAAVNSVNAAINEIKHAAIDDGKSLDDHPPIDEHLDHRGRLHRARELLQKSRNDIAREEDNGAIRGLRDRAVHHIDEALRATDQAIRDAANGI